MNIKMIQHDISPALQEELHLYEAEDFHRKRELDAIQTVDDLHNFLSNDQHFREFLHIFRQKVSTPKKILDIGVGVGFSSLFLAAQGYAVTAVEPSLSCCETLQKIAAKLNLPIQILHSTAEALQGLENSFDFAVFHSSLHHCDDPTLALLKTREFLTANGKLFLIDEPILRCYRTKKWFYRMLKDHPEKIGHYGGNEHIYRFHEYKRMIQSSGFTKLKVIPAKTYQQTPEKWSGDNALRYFIKVHYYKIMASIFRQSNFLTSALGKLLIYCSLIYVTFEAS